MKKKQFRYKPLNNNDLRILVKDDSISLDEIDTSLITDMSKIFEENNSRKDFSGLKYWNVSNVTNISYMFWKCSFLENLNFFYYWKFDKLLFGTGVFVGCKLLKNIDGLFSLNFSNIMDIEWMFFHTNIIFDIRKLNLHPNCAINRIFGGKNALKKSYSIYNLFGGEGHFFNKNINSMDIFFGSGKKILYRDLLKELNKEKLIIKKYYNNFLEKKKEKKGKEKLDIN